MGRGRLVVENEHTVEVPPIYTHSEWCRWLARRGQLDRSHRRCIGAYVCVAYTTPAIVEKVMS